MKQYSEMLDEGLQTSSSPPTGIHRFTVAFFYSLDQPVAFKHYTLRTGRYQLKTHHSPDVMEMQIPTALGLQFIKVCSPNTMSHTNVERM